MKNIYSLITRNKKSPENQDGIFPSSEGDKLNLDQSQGLDEIDKDKKEIGIELDHLEFTSATFQHEEQYDDTAVAIKIMNAVEDANEADEEERKMTFSQALKRYPKAAFWSVLVSTTLVMEGYDTALLNALFALPVFQEKFGSIDQNGSFEIDS